MASIPPIAQFGPEIASDALLAVDNAIGDAATTYTAYCNQITADLDQALADVRSGVIDSQALIDRWLEKQLAKVTAVYADCASCLGDYLAFQADEAVTLQQALEVAKSLPQPQVTPAPSGTQGPSKGGADPQCPAGPLVPPGSTVVWIAPNTYPAQPIGFYFVRFPNDPLPCAPKKPWQTNPYFLYPQNPASGTDVWIQLCSTGGWGEAGCSQPATGGDGGTNGSTVCVPEAICPPGAVWDPAQCRCVPVVPPPPPSNGGTGGEVCPAPCFTAEQVDEWIDRVCKCLKECFCPEKAGNGDGELGSPGDAQGGGEDVTYLAPLTTCALSDVTIGVP